MQTIYIDAQILQTRAFDRGMGKYSMSILRALSENKDFIDQYDPVLVLNKNLPSDPKRLYDIQITASANRVLVLDMPTDIGQNVEQKYDSAVKILTEVVEKDLASSQKASYLILAPFFVDFPAVFPNLQQVKKYSIVYDLIPYLIQQKIKIFPEDVYLRHYQLFLEADHIFSISHAVKDDLVNIIGIRPDKISNINGGPFAVSSSLAKQKIVKGPYILYPSAPIVHKNNKIAVRGFDIFNKQMAGKYSLLLTSTFDENTMSELSDITDKIVFTGNVSDEEMQQLYIGCDAVLFASLIEGLGMPILEGVSYNKPVACSNISVFTEMSDKAFYIFKPKDATDIAKSLMEATSHANWKQKQKHYPQILKKYQWSNSALSIIEGMNRATNIEVHQPKQKMLVVAPRPNIANPASRFIEEFYSELSNNYEVRLNYYASSGTPLMSYVNTVGEVSSANFDPAVVLYLDNSYKKRRVRGRRQDQLIYLEITSKKQSIIRKLINTKQEAKHVIKIAAKQVYLNKNLDLSGWKYTLGDKELLPTDLIDKIKSAKTNVASTK